MKTNELLITPAIAAELLAKNDHNRNLKQSAIIEYARQMTLGLWKENTGESIKISKDGELLDGQNRLHALIKAKKSLHFLVIKDLDQDIFKVIDQGIKRTPSDVFHTAGVSDSSAVSAVIRKYYNLKIGNKQTQRTHTITSQEALDIYNENPIHWDNITLQAHRWYYNSKILSKSEYGAFFAFFKQINDDDAFKFMDSLSSGADLQPHNPIMLLREKLIGSLIKNKGFKIDNSYKLQLIYKSWNCFRTKKKISRLIINENETFPFPI